MFYQTYISESLASQHQKSAKIVAFISATELKDIHHVTLFVSSKRHIHITKKTLKNVFVGLNYILIYVCKYPIIQIISK